MTALERLGGYLASSEPASDRTRELVELHFIDVVGAWIASTPTAEGRALLYAEPIYLQSDRSPMPELRLVVLALQDRLAYGPSFEAAMAGLFGGAVSSLTAAAAPAAPSAPAAAARPAEAAANAPASTDVNTLISEAARSLSDYQRLTAEGKLGEAGQKLEQLKRTLEELQRRQR